MGQKRRFDSRSVTSGLPRSADIIRVGRHVSKVPSADTPPCSFAVWWPCLFWCLTRSALSCCCAHLRRFGGWPCALPRFAHQRFQFLLRQLRDLHDHLRRLAPHKFEKYVRGGIEQKFLSLLRQMQIESVRTHHRENTFRGSITGPVPMMDFADTIQSESDFADVRGGRHCLLPFHMTVLPCQARRTGSLSAPDQPADRIRHRSFA